MRLIKLFLFLLLLPCMTIPSAASESVTPHGTRIALVIGNGSYSNGALRNPVNDAHAVATKLEELGFKVLLRENTNREEMHHAIDDFGKLLKPGGVGLFYYAGHGMQIKGRNFLIPVGADIQSEDDIEFRGIDANFVLSRMDAAHDRVNILVLDACRNNPFKTNNRSFNVGLAEMNAPKGTLIAFSTGPGFLAKDGDGDNSVYTKHLLEKLSVPALPVEQVFKDVRVAVAHETNDKQIPWESSSLMGDFYFVPPSIAPVIAMAKSELPPVPAITKSEPRSQVVFVMPSGKSEAKAEPRPAEKRDTEKPVRDFNRDGYEIENKAKTITADELPAYEARAATGDVFAQTLLGWGYYLGRGQIDGRGIPRNNSKMVKWTKVAADKGYPVAQNNLGAMYMDGVGVKMDFAKARHYFKLAADQGYITAQSNLFQLSTMMDGKPDVDAASQFIKSVQEQYGKPLK